MKALSILFVFSILCCHVFAQKQSFVKFVRTDSGDLTAEDVITTEDHVYALFSLQKTRGLETSVIIKMDSTGQLIWSKELGDDVIMRNQQLYLKNDGNIICVGESFDLDFGSTDIFYVVMDPDGDIMDQKVVGSIEFESIFDLSCEEDGDVVFTGAISDNEGEYDLFVQRLSSEGMLTEGMAFDIGTYNYPFDIDPIEEGYVISMRYTDRQISRNLGAVLWLDSVFNISDALEFSFADNQVLAQEVLYDSEEELYHIFINSSIGTGFILLSKQLENLGSHAFFADDVDHSYLINGRKYFSTTSGQFAQIYSDSLADMGYWLRSEETGVIAADYHDGSRSLYGVGTNRFENSGMIAKSFVGRNMSCSSYSYQTSDEGDLPIMDINVNVVSNELNLQITDHAFSWRDIILEQGDSCRVFCQDPDATFELLEDELTVELKVNNPQPNTDYEWAFSNGYRAFDTAVTYTFSQEGNYELCLYAFNACGNDTTCMEVDLMISGVNDDVSRNIIVYPNPTTDKLYFSDTSDHNSATAINVDGQGFPLPVNRNYIDIKGLSPGMYILRLQDEHGKLFWARFIRL